MTTIALVQAAAHDATRIHLMAAQPMNINLTNLNGGAVQFTCSNALGTIRVAPVLNYVKALPGRDKQM